MEDLFETLGNICKQSELVSSRVTDQSQMCDQSEPDIDYCLKRIKAIQSNEFEKEKGNLMARVFLRHTGSLNDHKGNYVINEKDLFAWFENLDFLKSYTEWDTF
jgi:hypothetical protein